MKKHIFNLLAIAILLPYFVKGQNNPKITFSGRKIFTVYRKSIAQAIPLTLLYTKSDNDTLVYHIDVNSSQIGGPSIQDTLNAQKLIFGIGYPNTYNVNVALTNDISDHNPYLLKIGIHLNGVSKLLDSCLIFYQPDSVAATPIELKLLKSNDDLKTDLNSLKSQILNGDTSKTYIGTLIIQKDVNVVLAQSAEIPSKVVLDDIKKSAPEVKTNDKMSLVTITKKSPTATDIRKKTTSYQLKLKSIDSAVVTIAEGEIEFLKITMDDGTYYENINAPIPILNLESRFNDKLINPVDSSYIFVKSALNLVVNQRFNFFPSDGTYVLNNNATHPRSQQKVYASNALVSFVDFRVFTDLFGALDNQANGLVQFEAKSKVYLHRNNIANHFMYLFYGLEPYLGISKFDSKYDTVKITTTAAPINRMDLFQRSFFNVGIKLNIFRWDFRPSNIMYLNYGYQLNASNVTYLSTVASKTDSIVSKGLFNTQYFEFGLTSKRLSNFGFDGSAKLLFQQLNKNSLFTNSGYNRLLNFNVTAFYYAGSKAGNCFFVRFGDYLNYADRRDDFYQLQFGYSLNLKLQK